MRPWFIFVDLQTDFLAENGLDPHASIIIAGAARLLDEARQRSSVITHIYTSVDRSDDRRMRHWQLSGRWSCEIGTPGHAPPAVLAPLFNEIVLHKVGFGVGSEKLARTAKAEDAGPVAIVAGVHGHACVRQIALDLNEAGFVVRIARDAIGSSDPWQAAQAEIYLRRRFIDFSATHDILASLDDDPSGRGLVEDQLGSAISDVRAVAHGAARPKHNRKERCELLVAAAARVESGAEELARSITREVGKPIRYARGEVARSAALLRMVARRAATEVLENREAEAVVRRRPLGTVGIISPWNNPLAIAVGQIAPALAFGNAVIWKPTPYALELATIFRRHLLSAGVEPAAFQLLPGGNDISFALAGEPLVAAICFTGSTRAGRLFAGLCGERFIPLQAELGGNNAVLVMADADLEQAARLVSEAAFGCAGQRCTAARRVIVETRVLDRFVDLLIERTAALACGDPWHDETQVGPMLNAERATSVRAQVERARGEGHAVVQPCPEPALQDPAFHPPTIVICRVADAEIVQVETFGPVLVVQPAADFANALTLINAVPYGLVSAMFGGDDRNRAIFLDSAEAGLIKFDQATVEAGIDVPFGGWKASGIGVPQHGASNREFFTRAQAVYGV